MFKALFVFASFCFLLGFLETKAQTFTSRETEVSFYSHAPLEDIEAKNNKAICRWVPAQNDIQVGVPIIGFLFEKKLMQEHFHENYMETTKYPVSTFKGKLIDSTTVQLGTPGKHSVTAKGELAIHGVARLQEIPCLFEIKEDGSVLVTSNFEIKLQDFGIKVPSAVGQNISENVKINIKALLISKH
ncbi:MAG: YceI family protein [Sphingobacteriia bacterium]|nr:YceI family protein [Sphingobacteriia bacterium]